MVAYVIVVVIYSLMLAMSARMKLIRDPRAVAVIGDIHGVPLPRFPALAALELAGAGGLLLGIAVEPLGVAAAIGLVAYFLGATASHIRVNDLVREHLFPALLMLTIAAASLVLALAA